MKEGHPADGVSWCPSREFPMGVAMPITVAAIVAARLMFEAETPGLVKRHLCPCQCEPAPYTYLKTGHSKLGASG